MTFGMRYGFGCTENDVPGQRGSPAMYKGNAEPRGVDATVGRRNTLENGVFYLTLRQCTSLMSL